MLASGIGALLALPRFQPKYMNLELIRGETILEDGDLIMCKGSNQGECVSDDDPTNDWQSRDGVVDKPGCSRLFKQLQDKVHYNWMIAYWMMEGYLGHVDSVEQAYHVGHDILMDCTYNDKPIAPNEEDTTYWRYRKSAFDHMNRLGIGDVLDAADMAKFGKLIPDKGVLTTLKKQHGHNPWNAKSLVLDGNQLHRQVPTYMTPDLKYFVYFNPVPKLVQPALKLPGMNLSVLVLRGCAFLEEIDESIGNMTALTLLEISGPCCIEQIPDIFSKLTRLRSINLSGLAIVALPMSFKKLAQLRRLILRGCSRLTELPRTSKMTQLKVVDLYGAKSLTTLTNTKLDTLPIQMLDLSHTRIHLVPRLFHQPKRSSTITHLFLRECSEIYVFDVVNKFVKLQVLDLSGAKRLKRIKTFASLQDLVVLDLSQTDLNSLPKHGFQNLRKLEDLNLSNTYISSLPSISHLSCLRRLIVRGCLSLETLNTKGLISLQILDTSGCINLRRLGFIRDLNNLLSLDISRCPYLNIAGNTFKHLMSLRSLNLSCTDTENLAVHGVEHLEILNLSETPIKCLPSISSLSSLKQLLLAGCSGLTAVPDLREVLELEVLDLSRTNIKKDFLHHVPISLQKLLLRDCPMIEGSLPLASLTMLQELDLRGSGKAEFPYDVVGMTHLNRLCLPCEIRVTAVEWSRIKDGLPKEIIWDQPVNIFESVDVVVSNGVEQSMSAKPSKEGHLFRLVDSQDSWEAYFKHFNFSAVSPKEEDRDAVISFGGVELVFKGHHPLVRKEPYFKPQCPSVEIHDFSSFPEHTKVALKKAVNVALVGNSFISSLSDECFGYMEAMKVCWINSCTKMEFVLTGENQNANVFKGLETLLLSNLASLKAFCAESENESSQRIESLKHMYIDCCSVLDKIISASHLPNNLETLQIKFCDELDVVCGGNGNPSECKLPRLHELRLLGLPKLKHIGADLPSLETLIINQCPNLEDLGSLLQCAQSHLTRLSLDCCPQLKHVFSSSMLPEIIQELEIMSCDELTAVFDSAGPSSPSTTTSSVALSSLRCIKLWNLPKLKRIGVGFPSLVDCEIKYCSRLPRDLWPQVKTSIQQPR